MCKSSKSLLIDLSASSGDGSFVIAEHAESRRNDSTAAESDDEQVGAPFLDGGDKGDWIVDKLLAVSLCAVKLISS